MPNDLFLLFTFYLACGFFDLLRRDSQVNVFLFFFTCLCR